MPGQKKIAFSEYKEIIGIIHATCRAADSSYSLKDCESDLTYKVFKYANTKRTPTPLPQPPLQSAALVSTETISVDNSTKSKLLELLMPMLVNQ